MVAHLKKILSVTFALRGRAPATSSAWVWLSIHSEEGLKPAARISA